MKNALLRIPLKVYFILGFGLSLVFCALYVATGSLAASVLAFGAIVAGIVWMMTKAVR